MWTALHYAAVTCSPAAVSLLLKRGADFRCKDVNGLTPREIAIDTNSDEVISCFDVTLTT